VCGTPIDLQKVTVDSFSVAGINDHITPWDAVYRSTLLLGGERRFVLSNSGHVQSISTRRATRRPTTSRTAS
jgi:polyhydroxyalkanoate synthase